MKNILALVLAIALCFSLVACKGDETTASQSKKPQNQSQNKDNKKEEKKYKDLSLYFSFADSLDPYKAESSGNRSICSLLFDSLVKLDNNLNPVNLIASNIVQNGKTIIITINSHRFSDGSYLSAEDVIYSIERCKKTKIGDYANQLENVSSYSVSDGKIYITLKRNDINAVRLLDFPIIKKGSANKTNEDGKNIPPIGSGRYVFVDNLGEYSLKTNEYYFGEKPKSNIILKNIPDYEALEYLIRSSTIDVYYSGFDAKEMPELKGNTKSVNLTNLVYVGINQKYGFLSNKEVRNAISLAVDRSYISEKCYYSLSKPALSLYNDKNDIAKNESSIFNYEENVPSALESLKKGGFDKLNKEGFYQNKKGEIVRVSLLYNKDNNMQSMTASALSRNLKACGINIELKGVSKNDYKYAVQKGQYELYLAEIRLTKSFDYSKMLISPKNILLNKADSQEEGFVDFKETYEQYMSGKVSVKTMLETFADQTPFIPLVFRLGTVTYSENFSEELTSSISDPYYNIEKIYLK